MSTTNSRRVEGGGPGRNWWLPALLALLILAIVLGAYFGTHRDVFGSSATKTPTPTTTVQPTATATPRPHFPPTATPSNAGPTSTPRPRPTSTPRPNPTATAPPSPTPSPAVTPTPTVRTGTFSYATSELNTIQQQATAGDHAYIYHLDPFQVVQRDLPKYGFTAVNIVSPQPTPQATPTAYTGNSGLPEVQIKVQYQGRRYLIVLDQPKTQGDGGIWMIVRIKPL